MSGERRDPPQHWRHGGPLPEKPPGLHVDPRSKPGVEDLLGELSKGLKPGEDPLFYELPEEPDDPEACAPDEARVYVGPTAPPAAHHQTMEMARVKVAPRVDPRRAETVRVQVKAGADPKDDAPPMAGPVSTTAKSDAGKKRTAAVVLGVVAVALVVLVATRGPRGREKPPSEAAAPSVVLPSVVVPSPRATVAPEATAIPSTTAVPSTPAIPMAPASSVAPSPGRPHAAPAKGPKEDDPYDAMPSPAVTAALGTSAAPAPPVAPPLRSASPSPTYVPMFERAP